MTVSVSPPPILETAGVSPETAGAVLQEALVGADDGELFLERAESESLLFDDGRLKSAAYDANEGFGLRVVSGETAGYAHSNEITVDALKRAAADPDQPLADRPVPSASAAGAFDLGRPGTRLLGGADRAGGLLGPAEGVGRGGLD